MNFKRPLFLLSVVALLCASYVSAQSSCNCAAFRLDDVQDFWLTNVQQAIIQAFVDTNTPLTVGVIGDQFGQDLPHVVYLRDQTVRNPTTPLEIACNGWQGGSEDFTTMDVTTQTSILQTASRTIEKFLWVPPVKVFIPPQGKYNANTLTAMRNRNMTHVSSFTSLDSVRPYSLTGQSVYRFPAASAMNSLSNPSVGITASQTYSQVTVGIARDGFNVIQLSIAAFAQKSNGEAIDVVNQTMITELKNLLTMTRSGGYSIVPISKINLDAPTTKEPVNYTDIYSCNCVAFRLDDVQDFYMTTQQYSIMNAFLDNSAGLTVGIIANNYGQDAGLVSFIQGKASTSPSLFEVANHGLNHEDFTTLTQSQAVSTLNQAQGIIQSATGVRPTTFLLPYNSFNNDTISAMKTVGFTRFSSISELDGPLYNMNNPDLYHFPAGSQTSNPDNEDYFEYVPSSQVWQGIEMQLDRDGFAVVMVHPQEFSTRNADNSYTQALNQTSLDDLISLIQDIKSAGLRIVPVGSISSYMAPVSGAAAASPSPQPSASASPAAPSASPSPSAVPSPSAAAASPSPVKASPSSATSGLPSFSPISSPSAAASTQPSSVASASPVTGSNSGRDTGDNIESGSVKPQPLGAVAILALIFAAVAGAQY